MATNKPSGSTAQATADDFNRFLQEAKNGAVDAANLRTGVGLSAGEFDPRMDTANERVPFVITTEQRLRHYGMGPKGQMAKDAIWSHGGWKPAKKAIVCTVNPSAIDIAQGLRAADSVTKSGTVQYTWRDPIRGTFFNEPKVSFNFQTGSIHPLTYLKDRNASPTEQPMASGLSDFYEFMQMLDEDRITIDGKPNYVYVVANTRKFPSITFIGFFEPDGITVHDAADDPNEIQWTSQMTCRHTYPRLYSAAELRMVFQANKVTVPITSKEEKRRSETLAEEEFNRVQPGASVGGVLGAARAAVRGTGRTP